MLSYPKEGGTWIRGNELWIWVLRVFAGLCCRSGRGLCWFFNFLWKNEPVFKTLPRDVIWSNHTKMPHSLIFYIPFLFLYNYYSFPLKSFLYKTKITKSRYSVHTSRYITVAASWLHSYRALHILYLWYHPLILPSFL